MEWVDRVIDIRRVSDRIIVIQVLVQGIIISVFSVYVSQCRLDDNQKDDFYYSLIIVRRLVEKKTVVKRGPAWKLWLCSKQKGKVKAA